MPKPKEKAPVQSANRTSAHEKTLHRKNTILARKNQESISASEPDQLCARILQEIEGIREIARTGGAIPILDELTAESDEATIKECSLRAARHATDRFLAEHPDQENALKSPGLVTTIEVMSTLMANNYVAGLRERRTRQ